MAIWRKKKEAVTLKHRLGRLLRPGVGAYFSVMAAFCAATLLAGEYWLAAVEAAVVLGAFFIYGSGVKIRIKVPG